MAQIDFDKIITMHTGAVAAVSAKVLLKRGAFVYGIVGLGNIA
ncbi:MAG: hypothetical protein IJE52_02740 [Bacteroidales bacterium]|nr:hypothetical protein [Bacteroidales bacterium]